MKKVTALIGKYKKFSSATAAYAFAHSNTVMAIGGTIVLLGGLNELSFAGGGGFADGTGGTRGNAGNEGGGFNEAFLVGAVANIFRLMEGAFGAMIMVVAGLGAIIGAAMGAYRAAAGMIVVAVGAFVLRSLVSLFFGNYTTNQTSNASGFGGFQAGGGGNGGN